MENESVVSAYFGSTASNELFGALAKAQNEYGPVVKRNSNPFFKSKYADLETVIDATKAALSKNGLSVVQLPIVDGGAAGVTTILGHASGQYIGCTLKLPVSKSDAQGVGSAITYARRYALQALVGVAAEEDDDGNAAVSQPFQKPTPKAKTEQKPQAVPEPSPDFPIDAGHRNKLWAVARSRNLSEDSVRTILGTLGYEHTSEIPNKDFQKVLKAIEAA